MVCGLGTFALALAVERVSKAFENWIDNKVLWMKEFPGTLVERGKSVARKGWLYFSRRSGEIGEVVILTGRRVAARLGEERAKWTEKWKGKGWFGKSNGKTEQWGGERYKKIQESMDWRKEKSGGGYLDQFSVKEGDEPKEQPGEKETKRSEVEGEWRTMAAEAWKSVKWDDKDGK